MRSLLIAAAFALTATAAYADDVMASRYGNTTITTDASGVQTKLYYNADGTFTGKQGAFSFSGTWKLDGSTICLTFNPAPPGAPNPTCTPVSAHKIGETWNGGGRTITLVQGIQ
jgi:YD repeat-containing protein